jgi:ABC-type glucose/galactose transport system permease subunit
MVKVHFGSHSSNVVMSIGICMSYYFVVWNKNSVGENMYLLESNKVKQNNIIFSPITF